LRQDLGAVRFSHHIQAAAGNRLAIGQFGDPHRMSNVIGFIFFVLHQLAWLYGIIVLVHVILSLLVSFNVVNYRNQFVAMVWQLTSRLVEPVLARIRRLLPFLRNLGGFDLSPIILLILVNGIDIYFLAPLARGGF
jgi:YggT family protein